MTRVTMSFFLNAVLLGVVLCGCSISTVSALPKQPSSNHAVLVGTKDQDLHSQVILASSSSSSNSNNDYNDYNQQLVTVNKEVNEKFSKANNKLSILKDRIVTSSKNFGNGEPFLAVVGVVGNVPVGFCLATLWFIRTFVVRVKTAPLLIKSSGVSADTSKRSRNVRGKEWRVTVRTLSNANLIMISGISSSPRRGEASAALLLPTSGSKLVLASGINSSTTVTMTPMAPPPPRTTTTTAPAPPPSAAVVNTASVYYPAEAAHKTLDSGVVASVEVQLIRNPFSENHPLVRGGGPPSDALLERLKIGMYFGVWYALNVVYNIINKKVLNVLPAPVIVGTVQFGIGAFYASLVWLLRLRPTPSLTGAGKVAVTWVGLSHSLGQLTAMISIEAGTVSFTHIVKALEPFFSAVVSGLYFHQWMPLPVYATLLPVVGGVGYACLKERSFSWLAFWMAMASNLAFALRAVLSKVALQSGGDVGTNLTPPNMFALVTWAAFLVSIPMGIVAEGSTFMSLLSTAIDSVENKYHFLRTVIISGLFHYLNNEVMYMALGAVHPVTLAVGNTMKRVFIMVASIMVFRNPISMQAGIGSGVGISGVLLYSLTKQYYESLEKQQKGSGKKIKATPPRGKPKQSSK